jgi:putative ABC transport system permease protein
MRQLSFNIVLAWRALRNNKLRSGITIAVIALGITALVGILTAIEVMKVGIASSFSSMGVNSFQINSEVITRKKHGGIHFTDSRNISFTEARLFRERFRFPAHISVSYKATPIETVRYGSEKTNPNVTVTGADDQYAVVNDSKITLGRNFSPTEIESGSYVVILGEAIAKKLFKKNVSRCINEVVTIGGTRCRVIGLLETKGGGMFMNNDNSVILPINTARQCYGGEGSYEITVLVTDVGMKSFAAEEAEGIFRVIRRIPIGGENNFSVSQNSELVKMVIEDTRYVQAAAIVICIITLINSVIGLMNIMLESVAERTREIGVSKALGARTGAIRSQFLTEAVIISLMGGLVGVIFGLLLGNIIGFFMNTGFVVPWLWIVLGVSLCACVGVISGIYPAVKASKLNPINALRYE